MNYTTEIIISGALILYILIELIRINFLKKDDNVLVAGLASAILLLFGIYLSFNYGVKLDYGSDLDILQSKAKLMSFIALLSLSVSLFFIFLSIIKSIVWRIQESSENSNLE